ncbi:hypothetical protein ONS95_012466 [Cadophora gregata]|uniref:uncharacterized protein n=1 Tax=Cadophora gregata TaxID=51156 RepID=UPI0026DA794A|nr:uncharacterized protein ONS95_012466 [Cadophora gregata]KAK0118160.1 hypothetical protein ONS95_012466 [Cadophora gregata]
MTNRRCCGLRPTISQIRPSFIFSPSRLLASKTIDHIGISVVTLPWLRCALKCEKEKVSRRWLSASIIHKHCKSAMLLLLIYLTLIVISLLIVHTHYLNHHRLIMPSPIRVGLVGLGKDPFKMGPGIWGASVHLPYLITSPKYTLVAVQNSTVESALASIEYHNLGPDIKAYGTPEDLAQDSNVDLVVVSIVVTHHYAVAKPALLAGKDVFVEWPLATTTAEAEELSKIAEEKGCKTIVGLQARASPLVLEIKEVLRSGKIGRILSSTVVGQISSLKPFGTWQESAKYYVDMDSGANGFYVSFGHFLNSFVQILGPFTSLSSILHTHYPTISLIDDNGSITSPSHPKTSPDAIFVSGTLHSGAIVSLSHITAPIDPVDDTSLRWIITGSEGALEITVPKDLPWQMGPPAVLKARFGKDANQEVEAVEWEGPRNGEGSEVGQFPAANTRRLYEAFADVKGGDRARREEYASFGESVETSRLLDWIRSAAGK